MKKRLKRKSYVLLLFCVLFVGLQLMGFTYAKWADVQQIKTTLKTGALEISFPEQGSFRAVLLDANRLESGDMGAVEAKLDSDGRTMLLTINGAAAAAELAKGSFIKLEMPIELGESGTVDGIEQTRADFTVASEEQITLEASQVGLVLDDQIFSLPENTLAAYQVPLTVDVYRQVEDRNGSPIAALYLWLTEESRTNLQSLQNQIISLDGSTLSAELLEAAGAVAGQKTTLLAQAEVQVIYSCDAAVYIEQGNENILRLSREE